MLETTIECSSGLQQEILGEVGQEFTPKQNSLMSLNTLIWTFL